MLLRVSNVETIYCRAANGEVQSNDKQFLNIENILSLADGICMANNILAFEITELVLDFSNSWNDKRRGVAPCS